MNFDDDNKEEETKSTTNHAFNDTYPKSLLPTPAALSLTFDDGKKEEETKCTIN